jgi:hypothetical protein
MQPVLLRRMEGTALVERIDLTGGVFEPNAKAGVNRPVFVFGDGDAKTPVFTCPVSAIPRAVWELLELWLQCRGMNALPVAGGVLDQPVTVRRAFPVFAAEHETRQRMTRANDTAQLLAAVMGARR